jgi:hypothetical protein
MTKHSKPYPKRYNNSQSHFEKNEISLIGRIKTRYTNNNRHKQKYRPIEYIPTQSFPKIYLPLEGQWISGKMQWKMDEHDDLHIHKSELGELSNWVS